MPNNDGWVSVDEYVAKRQLGPSAPSTGNPYGAISKAETIDVPRQGYLRQAVNALSQRTPYGGTLEHTEGGASPLEQTGKAVTGAGMLLGPIAEAGPTLARQVAKRAPGMVAGAGTGYEVGKKFNHPYIGATAGAVGGAFTPEASDYLASKAVGLGKLIGKVRGAMSEGAGGASGEASSLIRPGRGSAGDWASVPKENLWEYAVNPQYEGTEMQAAARRELERSGLSKTTNVPLRDKVAGAASAEPAASVTAQPAENQVAELRQMQNNQALRNIRKQNTLNTSRNAYEEGRKYGKLLGMIK